MNFEPEMIELPAGEFLMGCATGAANECPVHRVALTRFALSRYAVTNRLYQFFLNETGRTAPPGFSDARFNQPEQPVTSVSWFDAAAYCAWLSTRTGQAYRLPTEAEWEYAARGGMEAKLYPWGDAPPHLQPRYAELWRTGPEPVGARAPNAFGLYDLAENVHEWCADWYDAAYYAVAPLHNPPGPSSGVRRASRGGSWRHQIKIARVAARSSLPPAYQYSDYGFRCARSV
jgi:formylglycine-generating enzyme required for sulfatase activity